MARAIDADALLEKLQRMIDYCKNGNQVNGLTALFQVGDAIMDCPTLTPPNEWVSVENAVPDPGERVLATDGTFVGEAYRTSANTWYRHTGFPWRDCLQSIVTLWRPLPTADKDNHVPAKAPNETLRCTGCMCLLLPPPIGENPWKYCPNCGARIDKGDDHEISQP